MSVWASNDDAWQAQVISKVVKPTFHMHVMVGSGGPEAWLRTLARVTSTIENGDPERSVPYPCAPQEFCAEPAKASVVLCSAKVRDAYTAVACLGIRAVSCIEEEEAESLHVKDKDSQLVLAEAVRHVAGSVPSVCVVL